MGNNEYVNVIMKYVFIKAANYLFSMLNNERFRTLGVMKFSTYNRHPPCIQLPT